MRVISPNCRSLIISYRRLSMETHQSLTNSIRRQQISFSTNDTFSTSSSSSIIFSIRNRSKFIFKSFLNFVCASEIRCFNFILTVIILNYILNQISIRIFDFYKSSLTLTDSGGNRGSVPKAPVVCAPLTIDIPLISRFFDASLNLYS